MVQEMNETFSRVQVGDEFFIEKYDFGTTYLYKGRVTKLHKRYFIVTVKFNNDTKSEYRFQYYGSPYGPLKGVLRVPTDELEERYVRTRLISKTRKLMKEIQLESLTNEELNTLSAILTYNTEQGEKKNDR